MLLDLYKDEINGLCRKHKVKHLYAFGSVLTGNFTNESDVDFLVDIDSDDPIEYAENYFDLKYGMEQLLNRPVDLLEERALKNSFFRMNIDRSKMQLYGN
jgi:uncharacterized protein